MNNMVTFLLQDGIYDTNGNIHFSNDFLDFGFNKENGEVKFSFINTDKEYLMNNVSLKSAATNAVNGGDKFNAKVIFDSHNDSINLDNMNFVDSSIELAFGENESIYVNTFSKEDLMKLSDMCELTAHINNESLFRSCYTCGNGEDSFTYCESITYHIPNPLLETNAVDEINPNPLLETNAVDEINPVLEGEIAV